MSDTASVLFDAPGPKTKRRNLIVGVIATAAIVLIGFAIVWGLREQYAPEKWAVFGQPATWTSAIIPGLINTLQAAVISIVLAALLGTLLGLGRLSEFTPLRGLCTVIVEFFRAVPVLVMMFFTYSLVIYVLIPAGVPLGGPLVSLVAVVTGLTLYNASVIAELIRSGMHSLPKGQREAGLAVGLTNSQTRTSILLPQAITAMLPSLVSQLVVVLKDTALGSIVLYPDLLRSLYILASNNGNTIAALTLGAVMYIIINFGLTTLASFVQRRMAKRGGRSVQQITEQAGLPTAV
ncbi:glutamate transport system permease protein [Enemella evansiae]|nr:glutamate transport system permease protein [Enemella evansiae]